jgi:hypothetical protein
MQSRVVQRSAALLALCALAACGSNVNEAAATITYNAAYVGPATLTGSPELASAPTVPLTATLSMSQLASTVTGTIAVTGFSAVTQDTLFAGGVMGRTTPSGLDLTIVRPSGCAAHLTGPLTLQQNGMLTGTLTGSDCNASGQDDLQLTLSLTRQ